MRKDNPRQEPWNLSRRKKISSSGSDWARFYPDRSDYLLIKVIPKTLEMVSYQHDLTGDKVTWRAPHIELGKRK